MKDKSINLKDEWNSAKRDKTEPSLSIAEIIALSQKRMKSAVNMHIWNIAILVITLLSISTFFIEVAPVKELISRVGVGLMLGGLLVRIVIEFYSIHKSSKISLTDTTTGTNSSYLNFYEFRKKIHKPVTITIVVLYTIGFYMLSPEFSKYLSTNMMLLMDLSYLIGAMIVAYFIRKGIRDEMGYLKELLMLQKEIALKK